MSTTRTQCPRCHRCIEMDTGYDGEGGISYCCEYTFEWRREWTVEITDGNRASYEAMLKARSTTREGRK